MDYISIYDLYGVIRESDAVVDHPAFPNPRADQGDLKALADGILRSGARDNAIVVWQRQSKPSLPDENILLDGKRTVMAMLQNATLHEKLDGELPVIFWQPTMNDGLTPDQEAMAYMVRANSSQSRSGHKLLTLAEETEAARRLFGSGLAPDKIGEVIGYKRETIRKMLVAADNLQPELKEAVGDKVSEQQPLTRDQALDLADKPVETQQKALAAARKAAKQAAGAGKSGHSAKMAVGKAIKEETLKPPPPPAIRDNPKTPVDLVESVLSCLQNAMQADDAGAIIRHIREASRFALALKEALLPAKPSKKERK